MQLVWPQTTQISSVALASVSYTIHNINHAVMIILLVLNRCKLLAPFSSRTTKGMLSKVLAFVVTINHTLKKQFVVLAYTVKFINNFL